MLPHRTCYPLRDPAQYHPELSTATHACMYVSIAHRPRHDQDKLKLRGARV